MLILQLKELLFTEYDRYKTRKFWNVVLEKDGDDQSGRL